MEKTKQRKLILASTLIALGIGSAVTINATNSSLIMDLFAGNDDESAFKSYRKVTFTAADFAEGASEGTATITKYGNPFVINKQYIYAQSGKIHVAPIASSDTTTSFLSNAVEQDSFSTTGVHGYSFTGFEVGGMTINFGTDAKFHWGADISGSGTHAESRKGYTWSELLHVRGTGDGLGDTATSYSNINHRWVGPRNDKGQAAGNTLTGTTTAGYVDYWMDTIELKLSSELAFDIDSLSVYYLCNPNGVGSNLALSASPSAGTSLSLYKGHTTSVTAAWNFVDGSETYTWTSSDSSIFTVDNGVVTGVGTGNATLTLVATEGTGATSLAKQTRTWPVEIKSLPINVDGLLNDWSSSVLATEIDSIDSDGQQFDIVGFSDDTFGYLSLKVVTKAAHISSLNALKDDSTEVPLMSFDGNGVRSNGAALFEGSSTETRDAGTGLTTVISEMVFPKSVFTQNADAPAGSISLGVDTWSGSDSVLSMAYDRTEQRSFWGINSINPWGGAHSHFNLTPNGLFSQNGLATTPTNSAQTLDGSFADFPAVVRSGEIKTSASNGEQINAMAYVDDNFVYAGVTFVTFNRSIDLIEVIDDTNSKIVPVRINNGYYYADSDGSYARMLYTVNPSTKLYTYCFELALKKTVFTVAENGSVSLGIAGWASVNTELTCSPDNSSQYAYWGLGKHNPWYGHNVHYTVTATGMTYNG